MDEITYELKSKYLVSKREYNQLQYLRYSDGFLWREFNKKNTLGYVILAKNDNNHIVGWALIFERNEPTFFVYVRKDYRRLGIGRKLYKIATYNFGKLWTSKHNRVAAAFFKRVEKS